MNPFEYTSALQYKVKSLAQQIAEFKSGERYRKLEEEYKSIIRKLEKNIRELNYHRLKTVGCCGLKTTFCD